MQRGTHLMLRVGPGFAQSWKAVCAAVDWSEQARWDQLVETVYTNYRTSYPADDCNLFLQYNTSKPSNQASSKRSISIALASKK